MFISIEQYNGLTNWVNTVYKVIYITWFQGFSIGVYKLMIIILFSIPFPKLIIFVIEYLSRCATVMYQSLAMTTEISNIGGSIN